MTNDRPALTQRSEFLWEIPQTGRMRVPGRIYSSRRLVKQMLADQAASQVANVATLPGIVTASLAMPDMHWGYGFPIGGIAAFDTEDGVVSPGGVGYDVNCGVRLMASAVTAQELSPHLPQLVERIFKTVPSGVGVGSALNLSRRDLEGVAAEGARWALDRGMAEPADLACIEEGGCIAGANPNRVSPQAYDRGRKQVGTLGAGNHFLEIQQVAEIYDEAAAGALGMFPGQVTISVHCGSRGFGHQVCSDFIPRMDKAARRYGIDLPDRQLACAPVSSPEGQAYLEAMRCAVNYAFANRQIIAQHVRHAFAEVLKKSGADVAVRTVYEVAHNIAKIETHKVDGGDRKLCVHRKGATRAFDGSRPEVPAMYRNIGQPVLIPGDMSRPSYVLTGTERAMDTTFGSTCHGAGRAMSRSKARKAAKGRDIHAELQRQGILLRSAGRGTVAEEISEAYKDASAVVDACEQAGIARKVAQLRPLACIKG